MKDVSVLKLPPHSVESEQSLLGALLLDNRAWDRVADVISEADFYRDEHRRIFRHVSRLVQNGRPADVITVFEALEKSNEDLEGGGLAYLGEIANATPSASNILGYAQIVRSRSILRQLLQVGEEISSCALNPAGRDLLDILDEAQAKVFAVAQRSASRGDLKPIQSFLSQVVENIQDLYDRDETESLTGISTGFADLDQKTSGLQSGDMIVVAGRPSMGKTAFALNIAEHVAIRCRKPVAIFSIEMTAVQLVTRLLSSVSRIEASRLRTGKLQEGEWSVLTEALAKSHDASLYIDQSPVNVIDLRARARRLSRQVGKLGLIVIDYLQLMPAVGKGENRATEISEISRGVKSLAKELDVPILALSQLNREGMKRADKRPVLSDLRESGAIEQDADVVLLIHRDEVHNPDSPDKGVAEIIIAKQRNGPIGTVRLAFYGENTRFDNLAAGSQMAFPPVPPRKKGSGFEP